MNFKLLHNQFVNSYANTTLASSSGTNPKFSRRLHIRTYFDDNQDISSKFIVSDTEGIEKEFDSLAEGITEYNSFFTNE